MIPKHKKRISITLERTMIAKLRKLAKRDRRTVSATIELVVECFFIELAVEAEDRRNLLEGHIDTKANGTKKAKHK